MAPGVLGHAEKGQHWSRHRAGVSLPTSPPNSAPCTFTFSIFSSPELCIFHLPQLTPWKGADAAFTTGLQCSLSTSPPPEKELDQPRDTPLTPSSHYLCPRCSEQGKGRLGTQDTHLCGWWRAAGSRSTALGWRLPLGYPRGETPVWGEIRWQQGYTHNMQLPHAFLDASASWSDLSLPMS